MCVCQKKVIYKGIYQQLEGLKIISVFFKKGHFQIYNKFSKWIGVDYWESFGHLLVSW